MEHWDRGPQMDGGPLGSSRGTVHEGNHRQLCKHYMINGSRHILSCFLLVNQRKGVLRLLIACATLYPVPESMESCNWHRVHREKLLHMHDSEVGRQSIETVVKLEEELVVEGSFLTINKGLVIW